MISPLQTLCAGNPTTSSGFPRQRAINVSLLLVRIAVWTFNKRPSSGEMRQCPYIINKTPKLGTYLNDFALYFFISDRLRHYFLCWCTLYSWGLPNKGYFLSIVLPLYPCTEAEIYREKARSVPWLLEPSVIFKSFDRQFILTSSSGNTFRVTGHLWGESVGHRWIPLTKASDTEIWCYLWSVPEQTVEQTIETPVIWDAIALIMTSLQRIRSHGIGCAHVSYAWFEFGTIRITSTLPGLKW